MSEFLKALQERVLIGDGALGTQIYGKGVPLGHCYDELNLTKPHLIKVIHREYLDAGADILLTNTFTANRLRLKQHQLESKVHQINLSGVRLAREVAGTNRFVVGSIGPITGVKHEEEELSADEKFDVFSEQARALGEGGCDAISLETPVGDDGKGNISDFIQDEAILSPMEGVVTDDLEQNIVRALEILSPREERILRMRFGIGLNDVHTLAQVGAEFGVSRERIRQIEALALRKLRQSASEAALRSFVD